MIWPLITHWTVSRVVWFGTWVCLQACVIAAAPNPNVDELLNRAQAAASKSRPNEALSLATQAVEAEPKNPQCYYVRGRIYDGTGQPEKALRDFDQVLTLEPRAREVYQLRGAVHFKLAHFKESVADFDKFLEKFPDRAPYHWQRGISLYYAGRYEDGRRQFELHQTVNSNDVENAVWHFLCVSRRDGPDKARATLLKIAEDKRVPLMQIYALFAGHGSPEEVLAAARAGNPPAAELNQRLFYAHLYLGLYHEALGQERLALEHINRATDSYRVDHYMGDVARVHAALLRKGGRPGTRPPGSH